jgi:hypothetical protein
MKRATKDKVLDQYQKAKAAGKYMVAVWHVEDGKLNLFRLTNAFPFADIAEALDMLTQDLAPVTLKKDSAV